jgi:hypothetical protein
LTTKPTNRKGRGVDARGRSKRGPPFVQIPKEMMETEAFRCLSGNAWKLLLYLLKPYNGHNNGLLHLSYLEAKAAIGMHSDTYRRCVEELQDKRILVEMRPGGFHQRLAAEWRVTFLPDHTKDTKNNRPGHDYKAWTKEKPSHQKTVRHAPENGATNRPYAPENGATDA